MRIVILGSVALPVPPLYQGGTERIAYLQAKGLLKLGHEVTLIAAKGSKQEEGYRLVEIGGGDTVAGAAVQNQTKSIHGYTESSRKLRKEMVYLAQVSKWLLDHEDQYDIILNNMRGGEAVFLPIVKKARNFSGSSHDKPFVSVMHLPIFTELAQLFHTYKAGVITISDAQRKGFPDLWYLATVYNAIDVDRFPFRGEPGKYLLMMGSIAPHKNQKSGIAVAKRLGEKLIIAGKIGNPSYYEKDIKPSIDGQQIVHKGEVGFDEKIKLYQNAKALLFPILWEEPFGLVMIEAMACGTPAIAFNRGAIGEVIQRNRNGFIVEDEREMVEALGRIDTIDRAVCRQTVEERFTKEGMVDDYDKALKKAFKRT